MPTEQWLTPPVWDKTRALIPRNLPALPSPPDDSLIESLSINECNDELVLLPKDIPQRHVYAELNSPLMPRHMWSRAAVITRLRRVQRDLPAGLDLLVLDTWRSYEGQKELGRIYRKVYPDLSPAYIADPENPNFPAPHTTGAAVDLTLAIDGQGFSMGSDFDSFSPQSHFLALEQLREDELDEDLLLARDARRLLAHTMLAHGFAPLASEWWHFSYGDQRWALFRNEATAFYGPITPTL